MRNTQQENEKSAGFHKHKDSYKNSHLSKDVKISNHNKYLHLFISKRNFNEILKRI